MKLTEQDKKLCKEAARIFLSLKVNQCDFDNSVMLHRNYQVVADYPPGELSTKNELKACKGKTGMERIAEILLEVIQEND